MAFMRYARGSVVQPAVSGRGWGKVRTAAAAPNRNIMAQAAEILGANLDPDRFLLTHSTIVASVDVENVPGVKLGKVKVGSRTVNRTYSDYYIKPECSSLVNNNGDSWSRPVLLASYQTFIGGHNFCFAPGTGVLLADGSYKPIEHVEIGDRVVTHTGAVQPVVHKFERDYEGEVVDVFFDKRKTPISCTPNHPFPVASRIHCSCGCGERFRGKTLTREQRLNRRFVGGHSKRKQADSSTGPWRVAAGDLQVGDLLVSPKMVLPESVHPVDYATSRLLGYFLAEGGGFPKSGNHLRVCLGTHETEYIQEVLDCARIIDPDCFCSVSLANTTDAGSVVYLGSRKLFDLMRKLVVGSYSHDKSIAQDCLWQPEDVSLGLIGACINGDGDFHIESGRYRITSTSPTLLTQLQVIAGRFGLHCVVCPRNNLGTSNVCQTANGPVVVTARHEAFDLVFDQVSTQRLLSYVTGEKQHTDRVRGKNAPLRDGGDSKIHSVTGISRRQYAGSVFNLEVAKDHSYVVNGVSTFNCEHVQIEEQSKGRIIDAVARDIGHSVYIDILVATDRRHKQLIKDIKEERLSTLSMGCSVETTTCTKCGNVAVDEVDLCPCIKYEKLNKFIDEQGQQRIVAELCFPPGTRVTLGDGRRVAIDDIQAGDMVLSHTGKRREVVETFERDFEGDLVALDLVGVPQTLRSTPNHPYWVIGQNDTCACGCGTPLKSVRKTFARGEYLRKYAPGHNPTNVVSLDPPTFDFKEAGDLRVGDMVAMPVSEEVVVPEDVDETRARLLGWFLAEGSYLKNHGERVGIQFTLNADDEVDVAETLAGLLANAFPTETNQNREFRANILDLLSEAPTTARLMAGATGAKLPTVLAALKGLRDLGLVGSRRVTADEKDEHGALNTNTLLWEKIDDPDLRGWSCHPRVHLYDRTTEDGQKLTVCYVNRAAAEWFFKHAGEYAGEKRLSSDAIFWPKEIQAAMLRAYLRGDGTVDNEMRHSLSSVSETLISQMQVVAARCGFWTRRQVVFEGKCVELAEVVNGSSTPVGSDGFRPRHELHIQPSAEATAFFGIKGGGASRGLAPAWRSHEGCLLYRVRNVWREPYEGKVHNIAVNHDHSYLAEGIAVHNCGHQDIEDNAGVHFIEASWVATPAFEGAVLRNILDLDHMDVGHRRQVQAALAQLPPQWDGAHRIKAAAFRAGFDFGDQGEGEEFSEEPAVEEPKLSPLDEAVDSVEKAIREKAVKKVKDQLQEEDVENALDPGSSMAPNDSVIKEGYVAAVRALTKKASSDVEFVDGLASVNRVFGVEVPRHIYRAALKVGSVESYPSMSRFLTACHHVAGRQVSPAEIRVMVRIGKLLSRLGGTPHPVRSQ